MTAENIRGALTLGILIRGKPGIYLYRGSQPCHAYTDSKGNTRFSSEYPQKGFRPIKDLEEGEIGCVAGKGYQTLKKTRLPRHTANIKYIATGITK